MSLSDSSPATYSLEPLTRAVVHGTNSLFQGTSTPAMVGDSRVKSRAAHIAAKYRDEYLVTRELFNTADASGPQTMQLVRANVGGDNGHVAASTSVEEEVQRVLDGLSGRQTRASKKAKQPTRELVLAAADKASRLVMAEEQSASASAAGQQVARKRNYEPVKPAWHAPWRMMRVISGHIGWVRSLAVEPGNKWFASGSVDRTIKIWDLASGTLKLTLTGHISPVRGLAVSARHPYLFSCGEDKQVKCWDLETNKVVRHYHGHLSGVYALALHPVLDLLVTGGRDSVVRVWDMRTKQQVHVLSGHKSTISSVQCQEADPQVISGSMDSTVRLWDLAAGKSMTTLTHHKKSVRALALHPTEFGFASASSDNIKQWRCPKGEFVQNFEQKDASGSQAIINSLAVNSDGVLFAGADNGSMRFHDWKSGHCFQEAETVVQPGSLDSEAGVFCSTFDRTGFRLITGEADKTIKIWKEDDEATEDSHPIDFRPSLNQRRRH
ncbi:pre-mRNA-splicing factor prp46 [Coemansia sp. BCRC 34301]|nr:pre-mRNA-splicing factor prp46 [Coemansia sp. BCRC 34301]